MKTKYFILALVICCSIINVSAQTTFTKGLLKFTTTSDSTVNVGKEESVVYKGKLVIPASVEYAGTQYSVTSIKSFSNCKYLTSVTIPNSVTSIGNNAFSGCSGLTSIDIPNSVTSIGYSAFENCRGLPSVTIPNSVTRIENYTFSGCSSLTSVTIPNSVTSIGSYAFRDCSGLTSVTIGSSVPSIGNSAFEGCTGLTSVTINSNAILSNSSSSLNLKDIFGEQVEKYQIGNSVEKIGDCAFSGCSGLKSVTIPNSVTSIGWGAFFGCSGLTSVTIPNSVTSIGYSAFEGCSGLKSVTIPNSVTSIEYSVFSGCRGLTSVTIPNSVTSIGSYAFFGCSSLTSVTIPNSVTSIGSYAFGNCNGLTSVTIPNSVTTIGSNAFEGCSGLTSVTIGNSVTSIGNRAFYKCSGLTKVSINDIAAWCNISFENSYSNPLYYAKHLYSDDNTEIIDLVIPNGVTEIKRYAFYNCSSLTSVTIPNSVTSIGDWAFERCTGLNDLYCYIQKPLSLVHLSSFYYERDINFNPYYPCKLHVPVGCRAAYRNADVWKYFLNIVEDLPSGTKEQTVTWSESQTFVVGIGSEIELTAIASSGLPVTYSVKSGSDCATLITNEDKTFLRGIKTGIVVIEAKQVGNYEYQPVSVEKEFSIVVPPPVGSEFIVEKIVYKITSNTEVKVIGHNEIGGDVIIPDKVKYPGFEKQYSVKEIGDRAFYDCTGMTSLTIPSSVKKISQYAFRGCSGMTELILADGVETIGYAAFELCTSLTSVHIPNSVTYIDAWAFTACYGLKTVLMPNSVTTINHSAFSGCNALENIYCHIKEPITVTDDTFSGVPKNTCTLYVPIGSKVKYQAADVWKDFFNIVEFDPTGIVSIDNSQSTIDNGVWFTLNGVQLNGKPTKAGIYIVNGKKVVIK